MTAPPLAVLIVDDESSVRFILSRVTKGLGLRPVEAEGGAAARALLKTEAFAVALIDKNLVGENGLELLREIRKAQPRCSTLIITGYGNVESAVEALQLGAFDYVLKPFDVEQVSHRIRNAAERFNVIAERDHYQQQAMQADRLAALGQLAAGVVHELNTPLSFVAANVELLSRELTHLPEAHRPKATELLRDIFEGMGRIEALSRDIRSFARAPDDSSDPIFPSEVADAVLRLALVQIRNHAVIVREYADVPPVFVSESRLAQVLLNLVVNAAQAFPPQQRERTITLRIAADRPQSVLRLSVRDNGPGVPANLHEKIFEPFFTTKPRGVGTGLGLAISKEIITSMGGTLTLDSAPGQGATFTVTLPLGPPAR